MSLGKYPMIAKGIKSPLEVCGHEFKMKPGSVMPKSFGWQVPVPNRQHVGIITRVAAWLREC